MVETGRGSEAMAPANRAATQILSCRLHPVYEPETYGQSLNVQVFT